MQTRYKPVGWRNEPHRHYLAAKGIKTKYEANKYFALTKKDEMVYMADKGFYKDADAFSEFLMKRTVDSVSKDAEHHNYMALKDMFKSNGDSQLMEDERPFYKEHKLKSEGMNLRMHDIGKMHDKVMNQLDEAVQKGELDPHKREEFFTGDFKRAKEDYLNKTYNTSQFNDEVERSLTYFLKVNGKNLHVFFWADKQKKEPDDQNREYLSGSHVGSGTI